jgi:hypothetical protein
VILFSLLRSVLGVFVFAALTVFFSLILIFESFIFANREFEDAVIQRSG